VSDDKAMQEYLAALFPFQREAIAMAQLAGCEFRPVEKIRRGYNNRLLMLYETFLPNGEYIGLYDDIYEGAVACLYKLNTSEQNPKPSLDGGLFRLLPENEQP
jgi:hypothetical protein